MPEHYEQHLNLWTAWRMRNIRRHYYNSPSFKLCSPPLWNCLSSIPAQRIKSAECSLNPAESKAIIYSAAGFVSRSCDHWSWTIFDMIFKMIGQPQLYQLRISLFHSIDHKQNASNNKTIRRYNTGGYIINGPEKNLQLFHQAHYRYILLRQDLILYLSTIISKRDPALQ